MSKKQKEIHMHAIQLMEAVRKQCASEKCALNAHVADADAYTRAHVSAEIHEHVQLLAC